MFDARDPNLDSKQSEILDDPHDLCQECLVAIEATRVRFPADALNSESILLVAKVRGIFPLPG